jgi:hypothetical protein
MTRISRQNDVAHIIAVLMTIIAGADNGQQAGVIAGLLLTYQKTNRNEKSKRITCIE